MSSFCKCKSYSHFFSEKCSIYAIFNDQSFNDTLINDIVSIEQLGPRFQISFFTEVFNDNLTEFELSEMFVFIFVNSGKSITDSILLNL